MFSWIPIYTELAKQILGYRNRQNELIEALKELQAKKLHIGSMLDKDAHGREIPLAVIDPFTFYACFNRGQVSAEDRRSIVDYIRVKFRLKSETPADFSGIPVVSPLNAWFFPYAKLRRPDDISSLWTLAEAVVQGPPEELDPTLFERCLQIKAIGPAKLTMGMFWFNPTQYVAWDGNNRQFFNSNGIEVKVDSLSAYLELLKVVNAKLGNNYPQISRTAWEFVKNASGFTITPLQLPNLWERFHERIAGFADFEHPGDDLRAKELNYKRNALERYQNEVGNTRLRELLETGQGEAARLELSRCIQTNLVDHRSWETSIGNNNKQSTAVLKAYLNAAEKEYDGPSTIEPIIKEILAQGLKPSWDTLSAILWAMRPSDYFPMKIEYYRELGNELGHPLPAGRPTAEKFDALLKFGRAFWTALEPQNPKDWIDVQSFIWVVCPNSYKSEERSEKQYWAGGFQWDETSMLKEFIDGNFWQIGWGKTDTKAAAKRTWSNFEQVNIGDEFAIKGYGGRNDLNIHYIGEVVEKSDEGVLRLRELQRQLYKGKGPSGMSWFDTLIPIKLQPIINTIFHADKPASESIANNNLPSNALNLILYGPPGTGKTYDTIQRAVKIIDPEFSAVHSDDYASHKRKFDKLAQQGRVQFITFHQSYSYEDFVEGIRPVLDTDEEGGPPRYECRPGAFKRLAFNALFDCLEQVESARQLAPFDILWKALLLKIESEPETRYPGLSEKTSYKLAVTSMGNLEGINVVSNKTFLCSRKILEQVFEAKRSQDSLTVADVMEVVMRGCHSQLVAAVFNELRRIEKSQFQGRIQPRREVSYTDLEKREIVQRFLDEREKSSYRMKPESQCERHVLIIDEINRGNISKILGELITLVENDKRLRAGTNQTGLVVTLPYSGEKFAVPANLYLLATMNTADKSIALVDLALRRRFDFEELRVDLKLCKGLTDNMRSTLQELNRRIALRKDRDHQIGHAYFVTVSDEETFNQRFRNQIIPLLQEYFYNDWEGLRYVLGDNSTSDGRFIRKVAGADAKEARTKWQWFFDAGDATTKISAVNYLQMLCDNYAPESNRQTKAQATA